MDYSIVVARYNEDLKWTKQYSNVIIYNKGGKLNDDEYKYISLKNVGREKDIRTILIFMKIMII